MAQHSFTGSHTGYDLTSARVVSLSGSFNDAGIVTSVIAYPYLSTTSAAKTATLTIAVVSNGVSYYGTYALTGSSVWAGEYGGHVFAVTINNISGFDINKVTSMTISVDQNGSYFFTKGSQAVTVSYDVPTANGAPTTFTVGAATANPSASVTLSWSGASAGVAGGIAGYQIQQADSTDSGATWGSWSDAVANDTASPYTASAPATSGYKRKFQIRALSTLSADYHSGWTAGSQIVTVNYPSTLSAPATASFGATTANPSTVVRFDWGDVGDVNLNTLSDYYVETRVHNGTSWGTWGSGTSVAKENSYLDITVPSTYGHVLQARVKARGSAGASYESAWKEGTNEVTVNFPTKLDTPATAVFASTSANPSVEIAFNFGTVADKNINTVSEYEIQYSQSTDAGVTWGNWSSVGSATVGTINVAAGGTSGYVRKARVRAKGSAGATYYSEWKESTNTLTTNYPTKLLAPTNVTLAATTANPGAEVLLNFTGVSDQNLNTVSGYDFETCTSTDGVTWSSWVSAGNESVGATSHAVTADSTWGKLKKFRVRAKGSAGTTYYSDWVETNNILTTNYPTKLSMPSAFSINKTLADPNELLQLAWSGAAGANLNDISGYDIDYRDSVDGGVTYGLWQDLATVSTANGYGTRNVNAPSAYGTTREYRIRVTGAAGETYYSDFKLSTNTVLSRTPTKITGPTQITLDTTTTNPGVATTLRWEGVAAGTINAIQTHVVQYSDSDDLSAWSSWSSVGSVTSAATAESISVTSPTTNGRYRKFRIQVQGSAGATYYSDWVESGVMLQATPITQVGAPTNAYVSPTNAETSSTLFFSGATQGVYNTVTGYGYQYADSADGVTYGAWSSETTVTTPDIAGSFSVNVPSTRGHYRKFRIRTRGDAGSQYYSNWYDLSTTLRKNTAPTAPTTLGFNRTLFEDAVRFTWSGATAGLGNTIASYTLAYSTSDNGSSFSSETVITGITTAYYDFDASSLPRAKYIRFRVLSVGEGELSSAYSGYSANARRNSIPNPPTGVTVQPVFDPANGSYVVNLTDGGDTDNDIVGYEVSLKYPNGTFYGAPTIVFTSSAGAASSISVNGADYSRGVSWYVAIRAYDSLGARSDWATSAEMMAVNPLQAIPSVVFPVSGKATYNPRPRIGMSLTGGTVGTGYEVKLTFNDTARGTVGAFNSEFSKVGNDLRTGDKVLWQLSTPISATTVTAKDFITNDGIADLPAASRPSSRTLTVTGLSLTDPVITVNLTQVKAVHITQLRAAINVVRDYYGLPAVAWAETLTANSTYIKASHIQEMRTAIDQIITYVNNFDPTNSANNIDPITWTDPVLTSVPIKKAHIQEIRDAIPTL